MLQIHNHTELKLKKGIEFLRDYMRPDYDRVLLHAAA